MPAPVWIALPPEVHSALLSTGPGPGPLLAAADTWTALSGEYHTAATELTAVLADAQLVWDGPTAAKYVAAHVPYLEWLTLAGALSGEEAARHGMVAAAYTAALAAMPTLAELAANHAVHGVLLATNFFGINTIPIAVNEADYARMWTQAATVMSTYQATTEAAQAAGGGGFQLPTPAEIWAMIFGADGRRYPGQGQPTWSALEYLQNLPNFISGNQQALGYLLTNLPQVLTNPSQLPALVSYFMAWQTFRAVNWTLRTLRFLVQTAPLLLPVVLNLAVTNLGGLAGLSGLAAMPTPVLVPTPGTPAVPAPESPAPAMLAAPVLTSAPMPAPAPTVTPAGPAAAPPPAPPAPITGVEGFAYLVGGPGPGFGSALGARITAEQPAPDRAAAAAGVSAASRDRQARAGRQRRATIDRGYRYEYLQLDDEPADRCAPSVSGAGPMGFAGTAAGVTMPPAGLTTLAGDTFGGGPVVPMLPDTWNEMKGNA
ncbi:hypothetical protein AWC27_28050 [Mycobacterium szulgai]|uniref:PPE family protein n=1 Tax=Mycobacterium szulgai TaxID=1787 RepID=A0A1X2EIN8_MYCSZ|nr:PPE family protein [Mycobacterium szulgai]ORX03356.1 hypothetical protein AWC27_28050 [Mycobacterium szulgai]